jgi:hypothetical protein
MSVFMMAGALTAAVALPVMAVPVSAAVAVMPGHAGLGPATVS